MIKIGGSSCDVGKNMSKKIDERSSRRASRNEMENDNKTTMETPVEEGNLHVKRSCLPFKFKFRSVTFWRNSTWDVNKKLIFFLLWKGWWFIYLLMIFLEVEMRKIYKNFLWNNKIFEILNLTLRIFKGIFRLFYSSFDGKIWEIFKEIHSLKEFSWKVSWIFNFRVNWFYAKKRALACIRYEFSAVN